MGISEFMEKDHDRLDAIFQEFQRTRDDRGRAGSLFNEFAGGLKRHIRWEEELLFPLFENKTGMRNSGPTMVMRMEHREIEKLLQNISDAIAGDTAHWEHSLLEVLSTHNQKEETILYPWMDRSLSEKEREDVFTKMV